jgi:hypothetical protein
VAGNMARREGGNGDACAGASATQLVLLDHGGTLDGEVIPPEAAPQPEWRTPSAQEAEDLAARINAAYAELVERMRTTVERAAAVGRLCIEAKARWRGEYLYWLETKTPIKRRSAALYMELARAADDPNGKRVWKRVSTLGIKGAVEELRRRRRAAAPARVLAPIQQDDGAQEDDDDDGPDRFLTLEECARTACREPIVWRLMGTDKRIELSEALKHADPTLHEREKSGEISLVEAAIEHAKSKVHDGPVRIDGLADGDGFTEEEKDRFGFLIATAKTKFVVADMVQAMEILRFALEIAAHDDRGEAELDNIIDAYGEIARRFHGSLYQTALDLQRDRVLVKSGGDGEAA